MHTMFFRDFTDSAQEIWGPLLAISGQLSWIVQQKDLVSEQNLGPEVFRATRTIPPVEVGAYNMPEMNP